MRRAAKRDRNHAEIVAALRKVGCTVLDLGAVGGQGARMTAVLAIDPGTTHSGWIVLRDNVPGLSGSDENREVLALILDWKCMVAIERVVSYGMPIGAETIETIEWIGRFLQAAGQERTRLIPRKDVCKHVCNDGRAKDANLRQALIDRWGGKAAAVGTIKKPGPLYGIKSHAWSALAVAVTALETKP